MLSFTKQDNKMFPEINDFYIFLTFLSFYRLRCKWSSPPLMPLTSHLRLFFARHCLFIKRKVCLMNHKILPRLQAVLLE